MLVTVLYSHIVLCLDNGASAWHGLSVVIHAAAELNCGISKGISVGRQCEPFPALSQTWRIFTDARCEQGAAWKHFIVCFQIISKQRCRHKGAACFKGWQRSLCTWSIQAQSSLSSAQTKTALCLSHACTIIKPTEQRLDRQPVCWDRWRITMSNTCTPLQRTHTLAHIQIKPSNKWPVWNGNPIPLWVF